MAMVFSLPGRQSGFEELARSAAARRGAPLSEAAMMQLAQGMGAEDPFPIGMQFSNDQPVAKPLTKEQQARANMAAVMAQLAGRKEQGIAKYEQGVADKQLARERIPRSAEGMTGIDEVANAAYRQRAAQARDDNARSMAPLAQVLAQVSQQSGPQGNLWRRDPRAAVALQTAQMAADDRGLDRESQAAAAMSALAESQADRASRERMHGATMTAQERREADAATRQKEMFELEQRIADKRQLDAEGREEKNYNRRKGESDLDYERRRAADKEDFKTKLDAERGLKSDADKAALRSHIMEQMAKATATLQPEELARVKPGFDELLRLTDPNSSASPTAQVAPPLAQDRFRQKYPTLLTAWDTASTGEGGTKKSMRDFLKSIPTEDIEGNIDALREYLGLRYQGKNVDEELTQWLGNPNEINRVRAAAGMSPTSGMTGMERNTERAVGDVLLGTNPFTAPAYWGGKKLGWY